MRSTAFASPTSASARRSSCTGIAAGSAEQAEPADACRLAGCRLERDQGAERVADQDHGAIDGPRRHVEDPVGGRFDADERRLPARPAVARQIDGHGIPAVKGEVTALEGPDALVHAGAVDEDQPRGPPAPSCDRRSREDSDRPGSSCAASPDHCAQPLRGAQRLRQILDDVGRRPRARPRGGSCPRRGPRPPAAPASSC